MIQNLGYKEAREWTEEVYELLGWSSVLVD